MKIEIRSQLKPFTHTPGLPVLIPGAFLYAKVYPTLIQLFDLKGTLVKEEKLEGGPFQQFTVMQDLERGCLTVFTEKYRYFILPSGVTDQKPHRLLKQESLSFGAHKKQEWEKIKCRSELSELFPIWFRLGNLLPKQESCIEGTLTLLETCRHLIEERKNDLLEEHFLLALKAAVKDFFIPYLYDREHQGILPFHEGAFPISLPFLSEGASFIRKMLFQEKEALFSFLPALAHTLHAGRALHFQTRLGSLHFEWSKKELKKVQLDATSSGEVKLEVPKGMRSFRLRHHLKERGERLSLENPLVINRGTSYLLDQFKK